MTNSPRHSEANPLTRSVSRRNLLISAGLAAAAAPASSLLRSLPASAAVRRAAGMTATAPVPAPAKGPAIPKVGYLVQEIEDRLFWLTDGLYQMMFLVTSDGVVAVDAPPTIGNNILRAIGSVTTSTVTDAVYSHHHADHSGAMVLYKGAKLYAHEDVAALLKREGNPNRPVPSHTFSDSMTLSVGSDSLHLDYHGPNHSPGNIFVYAPAQRTLMLVDIVFPGWVPFAYLAQSQDVLGWIAAPAQALRYPFKTYIGGHLTRLGTRDDVTVQQEYVAELRAQAAHAIDTFNVNSVYAEVDPTNPWAIFQGYLDGVASQVAAAVVPNWVDRLGGADVYTEVNAYAMVESLRIDTGHLGPFGIHP